MDPMKSLNEFDVINPFYKSSLLRKNKYNKLITHFFKNSEI
ncbi:hypothetical protein LEP1GSC008_0934 [Leptospira kirschneri serovar Bulgarica str. Nikolaevo]|uniref:Uncharacterized protein n=1 Tax=Leptospira kirschneri serovar Bulgarica str. Nikolaevo TaxID=1240687 RepID=M6FIS2_9LEPT|nr:hypothetical protein LEP1GSC008_0934 [Leptospira kirschneri serovar Bulgarica str. Nikolaevo]